MSVQRRIPLLEQAVNVCSKKKIQNNPTPRTSGKHLQRKYKTKTDTQDKNIHHILINVIFLRPALLIIMDQLLDSSVLLQCNFLYAHNQISKNMTLLIQ